MNQTGSGDAFSGLCLFVGYLACVVIAWVRRNREMREKRERGEIE